MEKVLSLSHVSYTYHTDTGETKALVDVSFNVEKGEFIAIVGPSGCGKSTLLHLIAGLLPASSGEIRINRKSGIHSANISDQSLLPEAPSADSSKLVGYMLQKDHLLEHRSILKNITLGLEIQKKDTQKNRERIIELLKLYGLYDFKDVKPSQLSGGMRQRAALIRTLALSPELLLLDEPFSALDYQTRLKVSDDIGCIIKKNKITAILVTHDLSEAISVADRVLILSKRPGRIKKIVPIHFAATPTSPEAARAMPEFKDYFNMIWKEIKDED